MTNLEKQYARALIVDDDPILLEVGRAALLSYGIGHVAGAENGKIALEILAADPEPFDLVLTDLEMPEMDGMSLLRNLSSVGFQGAVVVLSAMDRSVLNLVEQLGKSHQLNFLGVLAKPISVDKLRTVLDGLQETEQSTTVPSTGQVHITPEQLSNAITTGSVVAHFQAKVQSSTHVVKGAEALARWNDKELGWIRPDIFILIAESCGLINELTWKIFRDSLQFVKKIRQESPEFAVSVNLPTEMIGDLETPDRISEMMAEFGLPANSIVLEVTERQLLDVNSAALEVFGRLRMKGLGLAIDDFGTGQANLSVLKTYPFTELKIDRSFVVGIDKYQRSQAMVASCVSLARDLEMSVVAEGIETLNEMQTLEKLGIEVMQGYLFSKPLSEPDFVNWFLQLQRKQND